MPLQKSKRQGTHKRILGRLKKMASNNINAENKSTNPRISNVKAENSPLKKINPALKSRNWVNTLSPKTSIKKARAAIRSIAPRNFKTIIKMLNLQG
jgi:hypothetical protein